MLADFIVRQAAASAGSHAELYTINNASNHEIARMQTAATEMFGENSVVQAAATAIGTLTGANLACSPAVRDSARLIGQGVETGVNIVGSAVVGSPSLALNTAKAVKIAGGLLLAGGASAAASALPDALDYLPAAASVAVAAYNSLKSKPAQPSEQATTEEVAVSSEENQEIDEAKLAELRDLLKELNPEEIAELRKMIESLKSEIDPEGTLGDAFDAILDVAQEAIMTTGINFLAGSLGNVVRLKVINGAYDATVALAGKAAKKSLSALGDGYIARHIQTGAEKTARAFAHGFIAPRVATSDTVIAISNKAGDITTKVTSKGLNYVNDQLTKGPKKKRSYLKTAARVVGLTVAGAVVGYVAPASLAINAAKVGSVALGKKATKAYKHHKGNTPEQQVTGALSKAQAALNDYAEGTGTSVDDVKVSAAFIKLIALSKKEQETLGEQSSLFSEFVEIKAEESEAPVTESVVVEKKAKKKSFFSKLNPFAAKTPVIQETVTQLVETASAA
ncbi:MAG: hypothetical protein ACHQUC_03375 [Chlamydiales bacterium]